MGSKTLRVSDPSDSGTKGIAEGGVLGLAMVHGIPRQKKGFTMVKKGRPRPPRFSAGEGEEPSRAGLAVRRGWKSLFALT